MYGAWRLVLWLMEEGNVLVDKETDGVYCGQQQDFIKENQKIIKEEEEKEDCGH